MGRTARIRQKRRHRNYEVCNHQPEIISLNAWLSEEGFIRKKTLALAYFEDAGRGVLATKKIQSGEELLSLPLNLTINITTILTDAGFLSLFMHNRLDITNEYASGISFQAVLALYLVYLKFQCKTKWYVYLKSLPNVYTVPYFLPHDTVALFDESIASIILKQKDDVRSSYMSFKNILENCTSGHEQINILRMNFSLSNYEWAYFTVNTRCVYMDLSEICRVNKMDNVVFCILNDKPNIGLCPYLDLINHSPKALNESKLIVNKNLNYFTGKEFDIDIISNIRFALYTKNNVEAYSQLFICYGDSHNLKLITEYGFFLPLNELDSVYFKFEDIVQYLSSCGVKLSQDQILFINNHSLCNDLYIDSKGISFNFYALLMVLKYYYKQTDLSRIIYSSQNIGSHECTLNSLIIPMVEEKKTYLDNLINKLQLIPNKCIALQNCIQLMVKYSTILEKFIKN